MRWDSYMMLYVGLDSSVFFLAGFFFNFYFQSFGWLVGGLLVDVLIIRYPLGLTDHMAWPEKTWLGLQYDRSKLDLTQGGAPVRWLSCFITRLTMVYNVFSGDIPIVIGFTNQFMGGHHLAVDHGGSSLRNFFTKGAPIGMAIQEWVILWPDIHNIRVICVYIYIFIYYILYVYIYIHIHIHIHIYI